jgi:hypothetical protein
MFCPKSSPSHSCRWAKGGRHSSLQRIFYFGGAYIVSTLFCNGPIKLAPKKNKVGLVSHPPTNLPMKEGSLFCFVLQLWDPPNTDASDHVIGVFGKLLTRRGAWAWFHGVWTCGAKVLKYWMIFSLKISEELESAFDVVGKILMRRI